MSAPRQKRQTFPSTARFHACCRVDLYNREERVIRNQVMVDPSSFSPDFPYRRWHMHVFYGIHNDYAVIPFSTERGARIVAAYCEEHGRLPGTHQDVPASRVMAYEQAVEHRLDAWVPACGGLENPQVAKNGRRILFVFNRKLNRHAWMDLEDNSLINSEDWFIYGIN